MNRGNQEAFDKIRYFYRQRVSAGATELSAAVEHGYARYLHYVQTAAQSTPSQPCVLDVGCGVGWTSALMWQAGFAAMVVGVDIGTAFVDAFINSQLRFVSADATLLPFRSMSFDIVTLYQFLEHVPEPWRVLDEILRVLKPGGILIVAGPNLLSPLVSVQGLARLLRTRSPTRWFVRNPDELRSPFGNTLPEALSILFRNVLLLLKKTWSPKIEFILRTPDLREPADGDTDACYLLNPIDVGKYLSQHGLRILRYQDGGRLRLGQFGVLKGGTWVVADKPTTTG